MYSIYIKKDESVCVVTKLEWLGEVVSEFDEKEGYIDWSPLKNQVGCNMLVYYNNEEPRMLSLGSYSEKYDDTIKRNAITIKADRDGVDQRTDTL